jgi:hypothetical protein
MFDLDPQIRYSDYKERPHAERQARFISDCREGFSLLVSDALIIGDTALTYSYTLTSGQRLKV